ncbi:hypothetical protein C8R45DRAFT_395312 [Mycena sanguinolenta]|nr:hypothetical protein C8R45DRAFT_395312 [Mycena sanguinolenta]
MSSETAIDLLQLADLGPPFNLAAEMEEGYAPPFGDSKRNEDHVVSNPEAIMGHAPGRPTIDTSTSIVEGHGDSTTAYAANGRDIHHGESEGLLDSAQVEKGPKIKVTLWRLLNTALILVLGIYKAVAAYRGQQTAPTTLDWILGVLWAVIAYWVSFMEEAQLGPRERWFFIQDHSEVVFGVLILFGVLFAVGLFWSLVLGMRRGHLNWHGFWVGPLWLFAVSFPFLGRGSHRLQSGYPLRSGPM